MAFDERGYKDKWNKENMKQVKASYKAEFVEEFKEACKTLEIKQSDAIRMAMNETIKKAEENNNMTIADVIHEMKNKHHTTVEHREVYLSIWDNRLDETLIKDMNLDNDCLSQFISNHKIETYEETTVKDAIFVKVIINLIN